MTRDLHFQKPYQFAKSEKYEPFCVSRLLFWRQKWVAGARHGNSLVVRRVSPGGIIVVLFWTKYAVPRQIKPGILRLTTSRGQGNLPSVFIFVCCEEKGCCRIVSSGHLNFDCALVLRAQPPYARLLTFIFKRGLSKAILWKFLLSFF